MFLHLSVILLTGGGCLCQGDRDPLDRDPLDRDPLTAPPPDRDHPPAR